MTEPSSRPHFRLAVVPPSDPRTRSSLGLTPDAPGTIIAKGATGNAIFECGSCGAPLIDGSPAQFVDVIFRCKYGAFNERQD
jgi:hypothetical protein